MKKIKKLFAMLLALTMVLGMGVTSLAAEPDQILGNEDDRGTIKISGITKETNNAKFKVTAYQIIKPKYVDGAFKGEYTAADGLQGESLFSADALKGVDATEEIDGKEVDIKKVTISADQMNAALAKVNAKELGDGIEMTEKDGLYQADVPVGSYLVLVTGSENTIYNNMVVSVYYGRNSVTGDTLTLGENTTAKKSSDPKTGKEITSVTRPGASTPTGKTTSANIGDTIAYSVNINPVPNYSGIHPKLELKDTLSKGLTMVETHDDNGLTSGVTVKIVNASDDSDVAGGNLTFGTDYKATLSEGTNGTHVLSVNFVVNGQYTLKKFFDNKETTPALKAIVTYSAVLNNDAVVNESGNTNEVVLEYTTDSKVDGDNGKTTDEKKTHTYTFDIGGKLTGTDKIFTKKGEGDDKDALGGAEFTVYTDAACTTVYTNSNIVDTTKGTTFNGTVTSGSDGNLYIRGLAEGTYYMKETKAPAGYSINGHVYEIKIVPTYDSATQKILESWKVIVDDTDVTNRKESAFTVNHDASGNVSSSGTPNTTVIQNTKLVTLPSTGGIGTTIFTVGGCAIMIIAAALYFATRRKAVK